MGATPMLLADISIAESAITQWRQWQSDLSGKPEIVRVLGQGRSNQSYLLQAGKTFMALRINNNDGQLPGIDRQREASIWKAASKADIAPQLLFADERYLVSAYVTDNSGTSGSADQVFKLIEKCHAIEIETEQLDYARHIQSYWAKLEQSNTEQDGIGPSGIEQTGIEKLGSPLVQALIKQRLPMQESLKALSDQRLAPVLCHHDLVVANFVGTPKRLYLIDWEYAAKGMAVMDYAALAIEWGFSDASICTRTNICPDSLVMAKNLYRYMCNLWKAAQDEP